MAKKLKKSEKNKIIAGVCGGFAEYFKIDPTLIRLALVLLTLAKGFGVILYIIAAFVMPAAEENYENDENIENLKSANVDSEDAEKSDTKTNNQNKNIHTDEEFDSFFKK